MRVNIHLVFEFIWFLNSFFFYFFLFFVLCFFVFYCFFVEMLIFAWPSKRAHFRAGINPIKFFPVASCNLLK